MMQWWQFQWPHSPEQSIAYKELFAVVIAATVWGKEWHGRQVLVHCDNEAMVYVLSNWRLNRTTRLPLKEPLTPPATRPNPQLGIGKLRRIPGQMARALVKHLRGLNILWGIYPLPRHLQVQVPVP